MSVIKRVNVIEAPPFSQTGTNKFHFSLDGNGMTDLRESYFEFQGKLTTNLANGKYSGICNYGSRNPVANAEGTLLDLGDDLITHRAW